MLQLWRYVVILTCFLSVMPWSKFVAMSEDFNFTSILTKYGSQAIEEGETLDDSIDSIAAQIKIFGGNPKMTENGDLIVDGDVATEPNPDENDITGRKAVSNPSLVWPDRTIPYEFHSKIDPKVQKLIEKAIEHWETHTCIKFVPRTLHPWYLLFRSDLNGCYSFIGKQLTIGQDVSLGAGCNDLFIAIHEIGHAVGFYHEQARSDRGEYAVYLPENVSPNQNSQFTMQTDQNYGVKYDFGSIMHYSSMAFSKEPFKKNTLVTKNPHDQRLMGKYTGLTFRDRKIANTLYHCDEKCPNRGKVECQNTGYLKPQPAGKESEDCSCDCPNGTSGDLCEKISGEYYDPPVCGKNVTEPETIQTPNYPERLKPNEDCSWWIQAPTGKKVRVEFLDFSFAPRLNRTDHVYNGVCCYERVEIRTQDRYRGEIYCGEDIAKGKIMESATQDFVILITANNQMKGRGLQAKVDFI